MQVVDDQQRRPVLRRLDEEGHDGVADEQPIRLLARVPPEAQRALEHTTVFGGQAVELGA